MTVDLLSSALLDDPAGGYGEIRARAPIARARIPGVETPVWLVLRHEDVEAVLSDPRLVRRREAVPGLAAEDVIGQLMAAYGLPPEYRVYLDSMLLADDVQHKRLRRLASRTFTRRRVEELRPRVERIVDRLLTDLDGTDLDGGVELIQDFCFPLSGTVICELVGVDRSDQPKWRDWINEYAAGDPARFAAATRGMVLATQDLIRRRREEPQDDLVSGLVRTHDEDGDRLSESEMIAMVMLLVQAGHHTTAHFVANATVTLLDHPDQLQRLRAEPGLMPRAVHELLRVVGPVPMAGMTYASEDLTIAGTTVRRGEAVISALVAANHDPERFGSPEVLDISRAPDRGEEHVAFGHGPHYCLGAALARLEAAVALDRLLVRRATLALAVPRTDLSYRSAPGTKVLTALPVRL